MKRSFLFLVLILMIGIERPSTQSSTTVEGQLVDAYCYVLDSKYSGTAADDHDNKRKCGALCLTQGNPAGVLTEAGKVYIIAASSVSLAKHIGQTVRVTGPVTDGSIILGDTVEVSQNGAWEPVRLAKMM